MSNIYEINNEHIEKLNDAQLTKILSKLMYLEANKYNIDKSMVNCSLKITVSDGGEDASIKWNNGCEYTDWFKCRYNLFQCKATEMGPSKCRDEIIVKDKNNNVKLKPMVENVFDNKGCYILFYYKSLNQKQVKERIDKFREAIKESGKHYYKEASIYVYDANKIAKWVNNYLAAIIDVLQYNGVSLPITLSTWNEWSQYQEYTKYKFETDDTINSYIDQLREYFKDEGNKVARIVGLAGLGKTRIALEVFREQDIVENNILSNKVVYIDAAYNEEKILPLIIEARRNEINGIIVVDNCSIELHKRLVREIEHPTSKLNLLTIDYNLEKISANYPIIELKQVSTQVIKKIIKQSYNIADEEINRIAEFAQGFPQMAVLISEARLNGDETIGTLNDTEIANKLLWGRDREDELKLEVIKACSIFENFGFYDDKGIEMDYIAEKICDSRIDKETFYKHAQYFIKRGILDKRGRYLAVTPLPLAVRLSAQWWKECIPDKGKKIILSDMPNNMVEFLCKQISKLHFVEEAMTLTADLCSGTGPFGQAEVLSTKRGGRIFRALSKVNPQAASIAIYNAFKGYSVSEIKDMTKERRELIWALENLCFWKETFDYSSRVLLILAAAENESWSNNSTGVLSQLFHIFLAGTEVEPRQRLKLVKEALMKSEEPYKILAIKLLGNAIKTCGFSRMAGAEKQGTRPMREEWKPTIWKEVFEYWEDALMLLTDVAKEQSKLGEIARKEIASNFTGLVQYGCINMLDKSLNIIGKELNYNWIEIVNSIKGTIKYNALKLPVEGVEKLNLWLKIFSPKTLKDKLKMIVSLPNWEYEDSEKGSYIDISAEKCKDLAKECLERIDELYNELYILYTGEQRQGYNFGKALGELCKEPQKFIDRSIESLVNSDNPSEVVLSGFLNSLRMKEPEIVESTLDYIAKDINLKKYLVSITTSISPINTDIYRIIELLSDEEISVSSYRYLALGRCLEGISIECIRTLSIKLMNNSIEGKVITIEIIYRYKDKIEELKDILISLMLDISVINNINKFSTMDNFYWQEILKFMFKESDGEKYAIQLYIIIRDSVFSSNYDWKMDEQYEIVLKILLENYPKKIWILLISDLLNGKKDGLWRIKDLLKARWLYINDERTLIDVINYNYVIESVKINGLDLALVISKIIKSYDYSSGEPRFNSVIRYSIENFGENNKQLLENIYFNMGPTSWSGSIIPSYEDKIKVLSEYINYNGENVQNWARDNIERIRNAINLEKIREEEHSKGIY